MLVPLDASNIAIFHNLVQCYEAEFSAITRKLPNSEGVFELDTLPIEPIKGYFWFEQKIPAAFALIDLNSEPYNVNEFYVLPCFRKRAFGQCFFYEILNAHPGEWQVKQLQGAETARAFWRKAISKYTKNDFIEDIYIDSYWGQVTRQLFKTTKSND